MIKVIYQLMFVLIASSLVSCSISEKKNLDLQRELDLILLKDQGIRRLYDPAIPIAQQRNIADSLGLDLQYIKNHMLILLTKYDEENIRKIDSIINIYGYPGKSLVGDKNSQTAFLVIQHSAKIKQYLPMIRNAAERSEINFTAYATMLDRYNMQKGIEQIYGSQGYESNNIAIIWPIKDADKVNKLRQNAGFTQTVEEYSAELFGKDFKYKKYSLEEIKEIYPEFADQADTLK